MAGAISSSAVWEAYRGRKIEKEIDKLKEEAKNIKTENDTIQQKIDYYSTPEFVERVSKDKMNMQKADESIAIVNQRPQLEEQKENIQIEIAKSEENVPNYIKWWNIFFKYN